MATNPEALNSDLENSEWLETKAALDFLEKDAKEKVEPSITEAPYEKNWAIIFKYEKWWRTWQVVTRKDWNTYNIRVNEFKYMKNLWRQSWEKIGVYQFSADNESSFKKWFWTALNNSIGSNRDKLPKTSWVVYDLLDKQTKQDSLKQDNWTGDNKDNKDNKENNDNKETQNKFDTQYEEKYWVKLIRDKKLNFYVVKDWERRLIDIRNKLMKIPEFSYLSDPYYDPSKQENKIHSFNTPNNSLVKNFYLPIPVKKEVREITVSNFKSEAKSALNEMKNDGLYWKKLKNVLKKVNEKDILSIMAAYARSETSENRKTFKDPIWSVELHRWEPRYTAYSFSYFHILMEKTKDRKSDWPWLRARKNLWFTEWDCYDAKNACKLFIGYCFEKGKECHLNDDFFFNIKSKDDACDVAEKYNGNRSYWNKLWANIEYCKKV